MDQFGSEKAAGHLQRWLPSIVTFAEKAIEGFEVHGTSNPVERLMGEVSKRCKNQWMHWTATRLEAILQLRLVKYADPEHDQLFLDELLQRSTKTTMSCDFSIEIDMADKKGSWDNWYKKVEGDVDPEVKKLKEILADEGKNRVLDVGCGAGRHLLYLAQSGFELHGFDFSDSAISELEEKLDGVDYDADVRVADMSDDFPYEDEYFDAALAFRSIHHADLETINHSVDEIYRVLKSSGLVYVQVPTYEKLMELKESGEEFEEVEPGTDIPLEGPEEGVPHHNFRREEVLEVFSDFTPEELDKRGDQYCLLARKP